MASLLKNINHKIAWDGVKSYAYFINATQLILSEPWISVSATLRAGIINDYLEIKLICFKPKYDCFTAQYDFAGMARDYGGINQVNAGPTHDGWGTEYDSFTIPQDASGMRGDYFGTKPDFAEPTQDCVGVNQDYFRTKQV